MPIKPRRVPFGTDTETTDQPHPSIMGLMSAAQPTELDEPEDPMQVLQSGPGGANAEMSLAGMQEKRLDEMKHNLQMSGGGFSSGATPSDVQSLEQDVNENPYGSPQVAQRQFEDIRRQRQAEFAGFKNPQQQGQYAAMLEGQKTQMPLLVEQEKGRQQRQSAQQFGEIARLLNTGQGGAAKQPTPAQGPTQTPGGAPARTYIDPNTGEPLQGAPPDPTTLQFNPQPKYRLGMGASGNPSLTQEPTPRLSLQERQTVEDLQTAYRLMHEVRGIIGENMTPEDTKKIEQPPGFLGQLSDVAQAGGKRALYGMGFQDPTLTGDPKKADLYNKVTQLTELSKVMASKGMLKGMRNYAWIREIQDHLSKGVYPTPTQIQRLDDIMGEYPKMIEDIYNTASNQPLMFPQPQQ